MSDLSQLIFLAGLGSSLILGVLLAVSRYAPSVAIWPCPDHRSWQALTFWSLFRIANVSTIATLAVSCAPGLLESSPRLIALVLGALSFACYFAACLELGHKNLYGGTAGLRTQGIYRWSRNPQYATAIPGYIAFAIAAHSAPALALAVLLSMAFWLMAMLEEAWLERAYGEAYVRYRSRVPRFFNFSRLWITMQHAATFARRRVERLNLHNSTG
jgi:protein-S-isoprenylcysteine O-methyltransferase Ste14